MNYHRTVVDAAVRRHLRSWGLSDHLWVEVELRLTERLAASPTSFLVRDPTQFGGEGMVYPFEMIDPENRMRIHRFRFQVFYGVDEERLFVTAGSHYIIEGA